MQMLYEQLPINENFIIPSEINSSFVLLNIALDLTSDEAALFFLPENTNNQRKTSTQRLRTGQRKEILIGQLNRVSGGVRSINLCIQFGVGQRVILKSLGGTVHIIGGYKKHQQAIEPNSLEQKELQNTSSSNEVKKNLNQKNDTTVNKKQRTQSVEKNSMASSIITNLAKKVSASPEQVQPLRRSARARAPPKPAEKVSKKSAKRQKQQLKSMASYFQCNLDDDQDESFSKSDQEMEEDDESDSMSQQQEQIQKNLRSGRKLSSKDIQEQGKRRRNSNKSGKSEQTQATAQIQHFSVPTKNPYV